MVLIIRGGRPFDEVKFLKGFVNSLTDRRTKEEAKHSM